MYITTGLTNLPSSLPHEEQLEQLKQKLQQQLAQPKQQLGQSIVHTPPSPLPQTSLESMQQLPEGERLPQSQENISVEDEKSVKILQPQILESIQQPAQLQLPQQHKSPPVVQVKTEIPPTVQVKTEISTLVPIKTEVPSLVQVKNEIPQLQQPVHVPQLQKPVPVATHQQMNIPETQHSMHTAEVSQTLQLPQVQQAIHTTLNQQSLHIPQAQQPMQVQQIQRSLNMTQVQQSHYLPQVQQSGHSLHAQQPGQLGPIQPVHSQKGQPGVQQPNILHAPSPSINVTTLQQMQQVPQHISSQQPHLHHSDIKPVISASNLIQLPQPQTSHLPAPVPPAISSLANSSAAHHSAQSSSAFPLSPAIAKYSTPNNLVTVPIKSDTPKPQLVFKTKSLSKLPLPPGINQNDLESIDSPPSRSPSPPSNIITTPHVKPKTPKPVTPIQKSHTLTPKLTPSTSKSVTGTPKIKKSIKDLPMPPGK